jgi:hypothetical protein
VISEPPPLDDIVQTNRLDWLQWIVSALGRARAGSRTRYLIKLDSWHIRALPLFRAAFPNPLDFRVPRPPRSTGFATSSTGAAGEPRRDGPRNPRDVRRGHHRPHPPAMVRTRARWFHARCSFFRDDPMGMFVDYRELLGAICGKIATHFGLELTPEDEALVLAATLRDAKNPWAEYVARHETPASEPTLGTLHDLYRQLETAKIKTVTDK